MLLKLILYKYPIMDCQTWIIIVVVVILVALIYSKKIEGMVSDAWPKVFGKEGEDRLTHVMYLGTYARDPKQMDGLGMDDGDDVTRQLAINEYTELVAGKA